MKINGIQAEDFIKVYNSGGFFNEAGVLNIDDSLQGFCKTKVKSALGGKHFSIPDIEVMLNELPNFEAELVRFYDEYFNSLLTKPSEVKMIEAVDRRIKAIQVYVMFGFVYGFNTQRPEEEMQVYFAPKLKDPKGKYGFKVDLGVKENTAVKKNLEGVINAYRWDITDDLNSMVITGAIVKPTGVGSLGLYGKGDGVMAFVPFNYTYNLKKAFRALLVRDKSTLKVDAVSTRGVLKTRYISSNHDVLVKYGEEGFSDTLEPVFSKVHPFFYAPVVGATSFTLGLTRINFVNIEKVTIYSADEELGMDVMESDKVTLDDYLKHNITIRTLGEVKVANEERYAKIVNSFPHASAYFRGDTPNLSDMSSYLYSLSDDDVERIYKSVPGLESNVDTAKKYIKGFKPVQIAGLDDSELDGMLKKGVFRVVQKTKGSKYMNTVVTKNRDILKDIYGDDYIDKYESNTYKLSLLHKSLEGVKSVDDVNSSVQTLSSVVPSICKLLMSLASIASVYYDSKGSLKSVDAKVSEEDVIKGIAGSIETQLQYIAKNSKKIAELIYDAGGFYPALAKGVEDFNYLYELMFGKSSTYKETSGNEEGVVSARDCFASSSSGIMVPIKVSSIKALYQAI